ncbi:MAG: TonB-dependent receptor [Prevotellaceae bacterium]|jgi:TonB-linked SusC/RagA family outer membrane protein|nr:TonB-dependent receptor [Prevotellaceae bacterium]
MFAQTIRISGTVISGEDNLPIIGATVNVPGADGVGTITDIDGNFVLNVPQGTTMVLVSYIGMESRYAAVSANMHVVLQSSTEVLDEVVVVGYGVQRKKDVTSSISQIKGDAMADKASPSFMQQMAGRAAGVQVISGSGDVTAPPRILIRGQGTISSDTSPLYVINGVPVTSGNLGYSSANNNAMADINPSDIESMEILKDGAATAIYGSRAANGVVLITTKQGKKGAAKISYDGWMGVAQASKVYDLLNAEQFVMIANEKYTNLGQKPQAYMDEKGTNTNWFDHTFRTGFQHNHSVSISGATDQTNYHVSAGYTSQKGVVINNNYDRFTFYGRAEHKFLNNYLSAGISLNASVQNNSGPTKGTNSLSDNMYATVRMLPNVGVYNPDDPTGYNVDSEDRKALGRGANLRTIENTIPNIVWVLTQNKQQNSSYRLLPTAFLDVKPVSWLTYRVQLGADVSLVDDMYAWSPESGDGYGYLGLLNKSWLKRERWNLQNILTFVKSFGKHNVDATAVAEWTNYRSTRTTAGARDFADAFFVDQLISNTYNTQSSSGSWTTNGLASYIFRANYNYDSMVYVGGSVRRDGISTLHPDNRWGTFYGLSGALRVSNFEFWKSSPISAVINDFRLRGSYAEVGNDRLSGNFLYMDIFTGQKYGDQVGISYYQTGNKELKWETQKIMDIGFDMGFLQNRFNLVFAYWKKDNKDIVLDAPTPPSLGIPWNVITKNYGSIKNHGIELEVGGTLINTRELMWKSSVNFSTQNSKIVKLVNEIPYEHHILREGEPINALWGYQYEGVNMANGNPMYRKADGTIVQTNPMTNKSSVYDASNPEDESKASTLNTDDKVIFGSSLPSWFGGWDNTITWKNFDLNIFFRFSGGNKVANVTRREMLDMGFVNNSTEILGRWQSKTEPGDGMTPRLYADKTASVNMDADGSSRWIEKGDFLKLQNVALGYVLPKHICNTLMVERIRLYVQAQNLLTITGYSGLDPEGYTVAPGIDWNGNPQQRSFVFGINIGF